VTGIEDTSLKTAVVERADVDAAAAIRAPSPAEVEEVAAGRQQSRPAVYTFSIALSVCTGVGLPPEAATA
jgi:hypothetical protein